MISYYIIPLHITYVENIKVIESWEKIDKVLYHIPIVAVIEDSKFTHYTRFVVIYKGKMQMQGGSGSCYNPCMPRNNFSLTVYGAESPLDNKTMPPHMSKWKVYSYQYLLELVIRSKRQLLDKMDINIPLFVEYIPEYKIPGLLIGILDGIGMKTISPEILISRNERKQKLLT